MELFRISKTKYINDINGTGAKTYGARWNRPGVAALYTSEARSLAMLELIVHFASIQAFKEEHSFINLELNNDLVVNLDRNLLPNGEIYINDNRLWDITEYYFFKQNVLAIRVPSVLISEEYNVIINPIHSDFNQLIVKNTQKVDLDERFKKII